MYKYLDCNVYQECNRIRSHNLQKQFILYFNLSCFQVASIPCKTKRKEKEIATKSKIVFNSIRVLINKFRLKNKNNRDDFNNNNIQSTHSLAHKHTHTKSYVYLHNKYHFNQFIMSEGISFVYHSVSTTHMRSLIFRTKHSFIHLMCANLVCCYCWVTVFAHKEN